MPLAFSLYKVACKIIAGTFFGERISFVVNASMKNKVIPTFKFMITVVYNVSCILLL